MLEADIRAAKELIQKSNLLISQKKNEQVIRDSFTSYLRQVFPSVPSWVTKHIHGGESALKLTRGERTTTGFVDNLVDLTAIEYEADLNNRSKYETGLNQVKDYCASLLNRGERADLIIGILSDTVNWFAYRIDIDSLPEGARFESSNIPLVEIERINVSGASDTDAQELVKFLVKYLGRLGARPLTATSIAEDLGFESDFCKSHIDSMFITVEEAFNGDPKYTQLITNLWCRFVSYLHEEGQSPIFDKQTYVDELYIMTLAKLLCANFLEKKAILSSDEDIKRILKGEFFENKGLTNLVEYDYFGWLNSGSNLDRLIPIAKRIQSDLQVYNFEEQPEGDIFGEMMAQLANRSQRLLLGQEWTPNWLSKELVKHVVDQIPEEEPLRLVDVCCGSGSMIVEAVKLAKVRISNSSLILSPSQKVHALAQAISGFDIDPLAVILSKINWVFASHDLLEANGYQSLSIPVYHADSLFAITPLSEITDEDEEEYYLLRIAEHTVLLPKIFVTPQFQHLFDVLIDRCYRIISNGRYYPSLDVEDEDVRKLISEVIPNPSSILTPEQEQATLNFLKDFIKVVDLLDRDGRNGIWSYIIRNSYRPALVAGTFNGLVTNPPWLSLSKIANNPYRDILKRKAEQFNIKPQGASHLHIELSTIFLLHTVEKYLSEGAKVGCIVPDTVLNGHHHNAFRNNLYTVAQKPIPFKINEIWRLPSSVFKNKAIILYGSRCSTEPGFVGDSVLGKIVDEESTGETTFYRNSQGDRTAWTESPPVTGEATGFFEPASFRQGADIMPRNLLFYEVTPLAVAGQCEIKSIDPVTSSLAFTVKDAKKFQSFRMTPRTISSRFVFDILTSNLLTPFDLHAPQKALLPIEKDLTDSWRLVRASSLAAMGAATANAFREIFTTLDSSGNLSTIFNLIDTRSKLTQQIIRAGGYLVLTGAGGEKVCASYISIEDIDRNKLIIDQTLYWTRVETEEEALYLTGLLNSEAIGRVIRDFQPEGNFGKRHIHKLPFGVTPPFNSEDDTHIDVVNKTKALIEQYRSEKAVNIQLERNLDPNKSLASRRRIIFGIIKNLEVYEEYETACEVIYGL